MLGEQVDRGMNAEAVLTSLVGTEVRASACDFSLEQPPEQVYADVARTRQALIDGVEAYLREQAAPPIAKLIQKLRTP